MNPTAALWRKDVRQLFWAWCSVMAAALLSFWAPRLHRIEPFGDVLSLALPLGAFFGLPLLASLALGTEFQYRTFGLTLAQALDRRALWREKTAVACAAVAGPLLLFSLAAYVNRGPNIDGWFIVAFVANALIALAVLTFWTLLARGIIGGLALYALTQGFLYLALLKLGERNHNYRLMYNLPGRYSAGFIVLVVVLVAAYSILMAWFGRRSLLRYQSVEGVASSDILPANVSLAPRWLSAAVAPRPRGAVLNLVRREMCLLRPVWLLTAASVAGWIFVVVFHILTPRTHIGRISNFEFTAIALLSVLSGIIAVIAGALPIGEERNLGTHAIHMTLPLSARVQWLVKLSVALVTGGVCAGMLPVLVLMIAGALQGSATRFVEPQALWSFPLGGACGALLAFWCACSVNATVKAILWLFPSGAALLIAAVTGLWLAEMSLTNLSLMGWSVTSWIVRHLDPFTMPAWLWNYWTFRRLTPEVLLSPVLLYALLQSYRIFRSDISERNRLVRNLAPLMGLAFIIGVLPFCLEELANAAERRQGMISREVHTGIENLLKKDAAASGDAHPLHVTAAELAAAAPLSDETRQWLGSADISIVPKKGRWQDDVRCCWLHWGPVLPQNAPPQYLATINRNGAHRCVFGYWTNHSRWFLDGRFVDGMNGSLIGNCRQ